MPYLFIGVFLVTTFCSLIEQRIQTDEEQHVDHQKGDDPDYNNDNNLKIKLLFIIRQAVDDREQEKNPGLRGLNSTLNLNRKFKFEQLKQDLLPLII
jgi:hypothetical protein